MGIHIVQGEQTDAALRIAFENRTEHDEMLVTCLVLKLAAVHAPQDGFIEAVATRDGSTLFQLRTPTATIDEYVRRNLSRRQQAQLQQLLTGQAPSSPPEATRQQPKTIVVDPIPQRPPEEKPQNSAQSIADALVKLDLENVQVAWQNNGDLNVRFENRTYRSDAAALGEVMQTIASMVDPQTLVKVAALRDEVLLGVFTFRARMYQKLETGEMPRDEMAQELAADRDTWGFSWADAARETTPVLNRSRDRIDLLLRPGLEYQIGNELDPIEGTFLLRPEFVSTIGRGLRASVRSRMPLDSWGWSVDRALITKTSADKPNILWTASLGKFRQDMYGGFFEGQWVNDSDRTRLGTRLALLGSDFGNDDFEMRTIYAEHELGEVGLTARATVGRFLQSADDEWLGELERRFGESTLRLGGTFGGDRRRMLMALSVPFGGHKTGEPRGLRVRPNPSVELDYASTRLPVGDAMWDAPDLRRFRGDLTLPYVRAHPEHLFGDSVWPVKDERWVAPSFEGVTGLIRIPTADVTPDGHYVVGTSWLPKDQTSGLHEGTSSSQPAFATVGFLPNLELSFRLTFYDDVGSHFDGHDVPWPYDLDRSAAAQYRLFRQKGWRPALAVGAQDIDLSEDSPKVGRATYLVASRQCGDLGLHLGGGTGRFEGVFGGLEMDLSDRVRLLGEYDTEDINIGLRMHWPRGLTVDGAWLHREGFGAAVSYQGKFP